MSKFQLAVNLVFALLFTLLLILYFTNDQQFVYVDSNKLLNEYKGMQDARAAYQQKVAVWKANIDTLAGEVKIQIGRHEKEMAKMTSKERQLSQELIKTKQNQLTQYQQAMNAQAGQEDEKMTTGVIAQVNAYLKKYGKQKGYTIIFAATDYGNLAYAEEALDITAQVVEGLNNEYSGN